MNLEKEKKLVANVLISETFRRFWKYVSWGKRQKQRHKKGRICKPFQTWFHKTGFVFNVPNENMKNLHPWKHLLHSAPLRRSLSGKDDYELLRARLSASAGDRRRNHLLWQGQGSSLSMQEADWLGSQEEGSVLHSERWRTPGPGFSHPLLKTLFCWTNLHCRHQRAGVGIRSAGNASVKWDGCKWSRFIK